MNSAKPLEWRTLAPAQSRETSLLLDRAFGLTEPKTLFDDFPIWDPALSSAPNRYQIGGFYGTRLVSTASLRIARYRFADGTETRFGLIGAVGTHPEFVGRGFAGEALEFVLHEGERRGVEVFALWGSESKLYKKRKFEFGGKQIRVPLRTLVFPKSELEGYELRSGWDTKIGELFLARKSGLQYDESDVIWLSRHRGTEWRTLWQDGKCLAYCAWNRGIDLPNIVHELDGLPEASLKLLELIHQRYPGLEWIAHPELLKRCGLGGVESGIVESLAQFRFRTLPPDRVSEIWFSGMDSC